MYVSGAMEIILNGANHGPLSSKCGDHGLSSSVCQENSEVYLVKFKKINVWPR